MNQEFGINMYTLLITNKDLLQSTGNYIPHFVLTYKGKESEKNPNIYVSITESLCCMPKTNTTLQISYTSIKTFLTKNKN